MIRFSPRNRDMNMALRAADIVGHASTIWFVPVGDGEHVDIRSMSEAQLISIRVRSQEPVQDVGRALGLQHESMHPLGALVSADDDEHSTLIESDSERWTATNEVATVGAAVMQEEEPDWRVLMSQPRQPLSEGVLIDPKLLGMGELTQMLCEQVPALFSKSEDGLSLVISTETVTVWTSGMIAVIVSKKPIVN